MKNNMKNISLKEMLKLEISGIFNNYSDGENDYYWKDDNGEYREIIRCDLIRGIIMLDNFHSIYFDDVIKESQIYIKG